MDPLTIAALAGITFKVGESIYNFFSADSASKLATEGLNIDRAQLTLDYADYVNGIGQQRIDLQNTLTGAKNDLLGLKERRSGLEITSLDYASQIASYDEFLARYPAYADLETSRLNAQGKSEFRALNENFAVTNVGAAERGQSGGSAQQVSGQAMQDLADYAGDDLSLADMTSGNVGMFQKTRAELLLDLDAQKREAETQRGIFSTGLDSITGTITDFGTSITEAEGAITDIETALAGWDAQATAIEAAFAALLAKEETPKVVVETVIDDPVAVQEQPKGPDGVATVDTGNDVAKDAAESVRLPDVTEGLSDLAKEMFGVEDASLGLPEIYNGESLAFEAAKTTDQSEEVIRKVAETIEVPDKEKQLANATDISRDAFGIPEPITLGLPEVSATLPSTQTVSASDKARAAQQEKDGLIQEAGKYGQYTTKQLNKMTPEQLRTVIAMQAAENATSSGSSKKKKKKSSSKLSKGDVHDTGGGNDSSTLTRQQKIDAGVNY